jgi:hypothetical protein
MVYIFIKINDFLSERRIPKNTLMKFKKYKITPEKPLYFLEI